MVPSQPSLLQAEQAQLPQPFLIGEMFPDDFSPLVPKVASELFLFYLASVQISAPPGSLPLTAAEGLQVGSESVPGWKQRALHLHFCCQLLCDGADIDVAMGLNRSVALIRLETNLLKYPPPIPGLCSVCAASHGL